MALNFPFNPTLNQYWQFDAFTAPVALVYINKTDGIGGMLADERHGIAMDWATHQRLHNVDGSQISAGGVIGNVGPTYFTSRTSNPAPGANTFSVGSATLRDEDIILQTQAVANGGPYCVANKTGVNRWSWTLTNSFPFRAASYTAGTDYIQYNQFTGGVWQMTPLTNNQFVNYYVFATDFVDPLLASIMIIPGQQVHTTLSSAQAESVLGLDLSDFPSAEFAPLYQITFLASSHSNWDDMPGRCAIAAVPVRLIGYKSSVSSTIAPTSHSALSNRDAEDSHPISSITGLQAELDAIKLFVGMV